MSADPDARTQLALLGFTTFERRSFQAFFELGRDHGQGYEFTDDIWRAQCVVADADDEHAMARVLNAGLVERAVLLGSTPHPGAALQLARPINLLLVMRALDTLVGARPRASARLASSPDDEPPAPRRARSSLRTPPRPDAAAATDDRAPSPAGEPASAPPADDAASASYTTMTAPPWPQRPSQVQRVLDELAMRTVTLPANIDASALAAQAEQAQRSAAPARNASRQAERAGAGFRATVKPLPLEHILVIDQDASTLRLVAVQLQRFGFQVHLAGHPDDALRLLTRRFHDYVFMDPALPGIDALLVCRLARQMPPPDDGLASTIVLLADPAAPAAPLARALPAADACLKKPLEQQSLLKLVGDREIARVAYADTARMTTLI